MALFGRFTRFLILACGVLLGYGVAQFAHSNASVITVSLPPYSLRTPVYLLALVPLAAGLAAGWLYTVPARAAEFAGHWRSWRALRRMERENHRLQHSLDQVLDLPDAALQPVARSVPEIPDAGDPEVPVAVAAPRARRAARTVHSPAGDRPVLSRPAAPAS